MPRFKVARTKAYVEWAFIDADTPEQAVERSRDMVMDDDGHNLLEVTVDEVVSVPNYNQRLLTLTPEEYSR